jgi:hypothetical protein
VSDQIEAVTLAGQTVLVAARVPLRVEARLLALGAAIRVFARYPVVERLIVNAGPAEAVVSRAEIAKVLGPAGFAGVEERARLRKILADALEATPGDAE